MTKQAKNVKLNFSNILFFESELPWEGIDVTNAEFKIIDEKLAKLPPQVAELWQTLRTLGVFVIGIFWTGDHNQVSSGKPIAICPKGISLLIAGCDMLTAQDGAYHLEVNLTEGR